MVMNSHLNNIVLFKHITVSNCKLLKKDKEEFMSINTNDNYTYLIFVFCNELVFLKVVYDETK